MSDPEHGKEAHDYAEARTRLLDRLSVRRLWDRAVPFLKSQVGSAGRRPRRTFLLVFPVVGILFWICLLDPLRLADIRPISAWSSNGTSLSPTAGDDSPTFRHRLWHCLSFNGCSWTESAPTRAQILEADEEYLDPEHLRLPRMDDPYPDISKWSTEKKERSLRGLDWLLENYLERWRPDLWQMDARRLNQAAFTRLRECLLMSMSSSTAATCSPEEMTVILLGSYWYGTVHIGSVAGENIWARSVMDAFDKLGYSKLYAFEIAEVYDIHRAIPDLVHLVISDVGDIRACHEFGKPECSQVLSSDDVEHGALVLYVEAKDPDNRQRRNHTLAEWTQLKADNRIDLAQSPIYYGHRPLHGQRFSHAPRVVGPSPVLGPGHEWRCTQAPDFPQGIPLWKMIGFFFFLHTHIHPLGPQWTMSPESYATFPGVSWRTDFNMYTGYSIEAYCGDVVDAAKRKHRAYILAKKTGYLAPPLFALPNHTFSDIGQDLNVEFIAGIGEPNSPLPDPGVINIGFQTIPGFLHELGQSKALVGVGLPWISPTPYDALCMGVPFLNPIMRWDKEHPDDITKWNPQHEAISDFGEPWVYNYKNGNETELKAAIAKAITTPIEPFIPRRMTQAAMIARHRLLVETDWKAMYEERFAFKPV